MLFLYEVMCFIQFSDTPVEIRNGADVFLRQLIMGLGYGKYSESIYGLILFIIFLIIMCINYNAIHKLSLKFTFLLYMFVESLLWSFGFLIIMSFSENLILSIMERNIIPEQLYLAIGAGIWEEFLFRFGLIGISLSFFTKFVGYSGIFVALIAILFSAVSFSLFHYLGPFGDIFTYKSFHLRTLAGLFLGSIYIFRGLGITVYTHIFYDIIIISMPIIVANA